MNFSFGSNAPKTSTTTLGTPTNTALSTGFSLGTPPSLSLAAGDAKASPGFAALGQSTPTSSKPAGISAPFSLGTTPAAGTTASPAFSGFGLTPATSIASVAPQATVPTPNFGFSSTSTPLAAATSAPINFSLTSSTTTTTTTGLKLGSVTTTTTAGLGQTTTASGATTTLVASAANPPAAIPTGNITFVQLQENLKKWDLELEEQEKLFISQATQINTWDTLLNSNSDKIVALNEEVERLRLQQQQMDNELDFVVAQQKELEEVLGPLENQAAEMSANTDPDREHLYHMSETLDTQLKRMSEDLREIIDNVNESHQTQDSSDPIVQIGRVLNAHMGSLQWIDQMTLNIQNQLDNVTKLHDLHRRENERSFRSSYE